MLYIWPRELPIVVIQKQRKVDQEFCASACLNCEGLSLRWSVTFVMSKIHEPVVEVWWYHFGRQWSLFWGTRGPPGTPRMKSSYSNQPGFIHPGLTLPMILLYPSCNMRVGVTWPTRPSTIQPYLLRKWFGYDLRFIAIFQKLFRSLLSICFGLSMFFRYVWAFRTRVLKTRVPERAFWVNPFFQWYKVNLFSVFEQRNLFPPLKKRIWSSCGRKMVDAATRRLISDLGHDLDLDGAKPGRFAKRGLRNETRTFLGQRYIPLEIRGKEVWNVWGRDIFPWRFVAKLLGWLWNIAWECLKRVWDP